MSELHELFTHSQNPELDYSLIIAFLPLLKVDQLTEPQKEVLLAIFKRMNSFKDQTLLNEFFIGITVFTLILQKRLSHVSQGLRLNLLVKFLLFMNDSFVRLSAFSVVGQ